MDEPVWVQDEIVLAIQKRQLAEHGGLEGIRNQGLLTSALARPKHLYTYSDHPPDLASLAAAYAFGIVRNHPFVDGNKRTAAVVCETFIELNGYELSASDEQMYVTFLGLAEGKLSERKLAEWIRGHLASEGSEAH